jgi:hypothetical protein
MKQEALKWFTDLHLTKLGLVMFLIAFVAVLIRTCLLMGKTEAQRWARMPLEGDADMNPVPEKE